jgi:hypothetical protein
VLKRKLILKLERCAAQNRLVAAYVQPSFIAAVQNTMIRTCVDQGRIAFSFFEYR